MPVTALYVKPRSAASQATVRSLMMARSSQEGGGDQEGFERIADAGVMAEVQQRVDMVLDVPAVLSEEAVAEVFEGLAAGSRPRAFAVQEMILELQQAGRTVADSEGRDSLLVQ